jgi:hypothetical protein
MKKSEVQAAFESQATVGYKRDSYDRVLPVRITALNKSRRVYSRTRDFSGHFVNDGVEIEFTEGTKAGCREIVATRTICDYSATRSVEDAARLARQSEEARINQAKRDCEAAVDRLNAAAGQQLASAQAIISSRGYGITGYRIVIGAATANRLAAAIEAGDA